MASCESILHVGVGGGGALHLGVECTITFRIIAENQQLYGIKLHNYTTLMLFDLMLTVKLCAKINLLRDASATLSRILAACLLFTCYKC